MIFLSKEHNPNYVAKLVKLEHPIEHPKADRLMGWLIDGNKVWTDKINYKVGDIVVYFPIESCINLEVLAELGYFRDKTLNKDPESSGYFENKGRVRAIKLRGEPSEGFIIKYEILEKVLKAPVEIPTEGTYFDTWNTVLLVKKYTVPERQRSNSNKYKSVKVSRIADKQFRLHYDTEQFKKYLDRFKPNDLVVITQKVHGTSAVFSNIVCQRKPKWYENVLNSMGISIDYKYYDYIYSSRRVIKNDDLNRSSDSYYSEDLWYWTNEEIKHCIEKGITLYGEIVGQLSNGEWIQKGYSYGTLPAHNKFLVYRITYTNPDGDVIEFNWQQIKNYCKKYVLEHVPEYYYGPLHNFYEFEQPEDLLSALIVTYLEKDLPEGVPDEGICIRNESTDFIAYKLKSFKFLEKETEDLDKGEITIEDEQSQA